MKIAYIFFNGELLGDENFYKNFIKENSGDIFCADGGANIAYYLNLLPLEIWGDLDSIDSKILEYYKEKDVIIKKFPVEKDKTDSELLLEYIAANYEKIYCIAGLGGDIDHELTNLNLCFKYTKLYFLTERQHIFFVDRSYNFKNFKNYKVSFIIFSDEVRGLTLNGFKYDVSNLNLKRGDSRCISNVIAEDIAKISFEEGKVLAVIKKADFVG